MDLKKLVPALTTSKPIEIFKKTVAFNETVEEHGARARMRVGLSSGFVLEGIPLKMDSEGNAVFSTSNGSISYVNVNQLAGVEILNPEVVMDILTNGAYFEIPKDEVPTNLQLKRTFSSKVDEMESRFGFKVQSDLLKNGLSTETEKYQFEQFLGVLEETLEAISKDQMGKEALRELSELQIVSDENKSPALTKTANHIEVGINFKNKFANTFKKQLKEGFESNL